MKEFTTYDPQAESVKGTWHFYFNSLLDRFQEYAPDYLPLAAGGQKEMPLLKLSDIKAPDIAMFAA